MKNIKIHFPFIFMFITQFVMAQIPCTSGFEANGSNDYITIPNTDAINLQNTRNRTVEFWFKPSDITTRQVLYEEGAQVNVIMFFIEAGRVYVGGYRNNADTAARRRFFRSAIGDIEVDKWTHIAFTIEDASSPDITFKWYLDGVLQDTQDGLQVSQHSGNVSIGRNGGNIRYPSTFADASWGGSGTGTYNGTFTGQNSATNNFDGNISLFRIWNDARTDAEIDTNKSEYLTTGDKLVTFQDGDQMNYEANGADTIAASSSANGSNTTYTWTGGTSNVYSNDANWTGTAPDITKTQTVTFNSGTNDPSITTEVKIGRLTVDSGVEVVVQNGATLNVFYELTNNGTITVEDGGALIFHSCNTTIQGSGNFNIKRATPTYSGNDFYSYWSSPVVASDSNIATVFPDAELIYAFQSSVESSDWVFHGTSNFNPGVGYAIQNEGLGGQLRTFSGKINEGDITVNVYNTSNLAGEGSDGVEWSESGDNLVGNPYASAINWDLVVADTDNADIDGTVYFWNQNTAEVGENNVSDYIQYNNTGGATEGVTGMIGSGQGFFVKTSANSTITFKTTHQVVANNNQFYKGGKSKSSKKDGRSWFTFNHKDKTNTLLVGFLDKATNRFDRLFDATFDDNQKSLGFYSIVRGGLKTAIQGLPTLKRDKKVVKLGFIVDEIGEYSIGIQKEYIDEDYYIYLRDTEKKITTDLRKRKYSFTIDSVGENNTRFKLIYTKKRRKASNNKSNGKESYTVKEIDSKDFSVYVDGAKELIVEYDFDVDNIKEVSIFNIQGKKVASFNGKQTKNISNLTSGVYIINARLKDSRILNKKIVIAN